MIDMNGETISDNKNRPIYQISLDSTSLGLINPYLFVEKLRDEIFIKLPNIKVIVAYNPKGKGQALVNLKFFSSNSTPNYQANDLQQKISFIASTLRDELIDRIEAAQRSVA